MHSRYTLRDKLSADHSSTDESDYTQDGIFDFEYDEEKDDYLIPKGWWEDVSFGEEFSSVDEKVIA